MNVTSHILVTVLLQHDADPQIKNTDGKTPLDLADAAAKQVLTGEPSGQMRSRAEIVVLM